MFCHDSMDFLPKHQKQGDFGLGIQTDYLVVTTYSEGHVVTVCVHCLVNVVLTVVCFHGRQNQSELFYAAVGTQLFSTGY